MLFRPLFVTLLAAVPSGALAFGDLDCIGTEVCTETGCASSQTVFHISYNETDSSVALRVDDQSTATIYGDANFDPNAVPDVLYFSNSEVSGVLHVFLEENVRIGLTQDRALHYATCTAAGGV